MLVDWSGIYMMLLFKILNLNRILTKNLRGAQSRSATPRTSVAQQTALLSVPVHKSPSARSSRGIGEATVTVAPTRAVRMIVARMLKRV